VTYHQIFDETRTQNKQYEQKATYSTKNPKPTETSTHPRNTRDLNRSERNHSSKPLNGEADSPPKNLPTNTKSTNSKQPLQPENTKTTPPSKQNQTSNTANLEMASEAAR